MFGQSSDFSPIDLVASVATNAAATHFACKSDSMRLGIKGKDGTIQPWMDVRLLGGLAAAAVAQFGGPRTARAGHDIANGLLNSFVATETCFAHAKALTQAQAGGKNQGQLSDGLSASAQGQRSRVYEGSANMGW